MSAKQEAAFRNDCPCTATRKADSFTATTTNTAICRCTSSPGSIYCARLRTSDQDAAAGVAAEVERIVDRLRAQWPDVPIVVRGDSGVCREQLMTWCEAHSVSYVLGFARNDRLRQMIAPR
ncbi:MAG: transposase [Acidobacteria bacterium]|nr:transposase [Acidobacteriota bacterium]